MTVWQRISGLALAVSGAGSTLLGELAGTLGLERTGTAPEKGVTFTIGVIALAAKMAKADGIVVPIEVETFRRVFAFAPEQAGNVARVFDLAKQDVAGYEIYADQIGRVLAADRKLLQNVLEGLMLVAIADGIVHPKEDAFLSTVAARFGFSDSQYRLFRARFVKDVESPYEVLRLEPTASDAEVRARYRQLVIDNHPDRLMGRGVPPEFVALADRKLAAINAAYDLIARERGM
ncbi:MAG: DnaJ family molecular chaperone [Hyphomicrobiaceae bacterium]|nr:DnaJ family molecular chaperone [Hyphomicrobiaceae bacterium]